MTRELVSMRSCGDEVEIVDSGALALVREDRVTVDVSSYGREGDAGIFAKSPLWKNLSKAMKFLRPEPLREIRQFYLT